MPRLSNLAFIAVKHGSAVFRHTHHHHPCQFLPHNPSMLSPDRRFAVFQPSYQYRASAWLFSQRPQDSGVSEWNVGEPPIDERHTQRGVTNDAKVNEESATGHTATPHLGKETDTREMLRAAAKETEERLFHEARTDGTVEEEEKEGDSSVSGRMIGEEEGKSVWALGMKVTVKCPGAMTGGCYSTMEYNLAPGDGCETHIHQREIEAWYLLEGEMQWQVGEKSYQAKKGCFIHLPKQVPHSFHNNSAQPARMLVSCLPAGFENYFLEIGVAVDPDPQAKKPASTEEDARAATYVGKKYGISFTPPRSLNI